MSVEIVYLDTSALIKRYVMEPSGDLVRNYFLKAYSGENILAFSIWNIGEVLGVLDRARRKGRLVPEEYR